MGENAMRTAGIAPNGRATTTTSGVAARALEQERGAVKSGYIIGRGADLFFIILCPLWALALGFVAGRVPSQADQFMFFAVQVSFIVAFQTTLTHAHLVIVLFRSHANPNIFRQFPRRFTVVPAAVLVAQLVSHWVLLFAVAVTVLWDVYHSAMQTFGFGRIYDARRGVDPEHGRRLDIGLNLLMYIGPILAGMLLVAHLNSLKRINEVGSHLFDFVPAAAARYHGALTVAVFLLAAGFLAYYVVWQVRSARAGIPVSWQKVVLFVSTGFVSIVAWGFNSFGQAFLIMNVFHAVQYFAMVWWAERTTIERTFRVHGTAIARFVAPWLFVLSALLYGFWIGWGYEYWSGRGAWVLLALVNTVAIMHFWYDGFVWSVRKHQVVQT